MRKPIVSAEFGDAAEAILRETEYGQEILDRLKAEAEERERHCEENRRMEAKREQRKAEEAEAERLEPQVREALDRLRTNDRAKALYAAEHRAERGDADDWEPADLDALWDDAGEVRLPEVAGLFYSAAVNAVHAPSEAGKTWFALIAAAEVLAAGGRVVMLDFEDRPESAVRRLRALAVPREAVERFAYLNPSTYDEQGRDGLEALVREAKLVIIDATTEVLAAMGGLSSNSDVDIADYMTALPKWAARLGPAVAVLDHATKESAARGMPQMQGSQHKRSAIDGVAYVLVPDKPFSAEDDGGHSWVYVDKDKHGGVKTTRTGKGRFFGHLRGGPSGFRIEPPSPTDALTTPHDPAAREAAAKDRLESHTVRIVKKAGPFRSARQIITALHDDGVKFPKAHLTGEFLGSLVDRGFLRRGPEGYEFGKPYVVEYDPSEEDEREVPS